MARGKARPEAIPGSMGEGSNAALGHLGRNPLGRGPFRVSPCCSSLVYRQYTALVAPCETRNGPPSPPYLWCYQALRAMNRRLSESRIRSTCRELLGKKGRVSGRALCAELRKRFGAVGKTERVFAIWREETQAKGSGGGCVGGHRRAATAPRGRGGGRGGEPQARGACGISRAGTSGEVGGGGGCVEAARQGSAGAVGGNSTIVFRAGVNPSMHGARGKRLLCFTPRHMIFECPCCKAREWPSVRCMRRIGLRRWLWWRR